MTVLLVTAMIMACNRGPAPLKPGQNSYGEVITEDGATNFYGLASSLKASDTLQIKLDGIIEEVCQAKGCWMTLMDSKKSSSVFVRFKDYSFFVPKDAGGNRAIVEGQLFTQVTPVETLRHYARDKGASEDEIAAITEPKQEIHMMASGVLIYEE